MLTNKKNGTLSSNDDEITYSKDHIINYVERDETIKAIRLEQESNWYLWQLKEKLDNSIDNIWKHYSTIADPSARTVVTRVIIDTNSKLFNCKVRNANPENKTVFKDLESNLNYSLTAGTKQNEYVITRGYLGDALKRIHAIGYVLAKETGLAQWSYPMIFRFNNKVYHSMLNVDRMTPKIDATPILQVDKKKKLDSSSTDTEIENTWIFPSESIMNAVTTQKIIDFFKCYSLFTTDIYFYLELHDDRHAQYYGKQPSVVKIRATTDKPISKKWINAPSIFAYSLDEFAKRIYATHHKKTTTVYQFVKQFREWNQVSKSDCPDLANVSVYDFLSEDQSNQDKAIKDLFYRLRTDGTVTEPPDKISLPYTVKQERKESLIDRLADILPFEPEVLDTKRAVYEIIADAKHSYKDSGSGETIQFPYAIEIVAIPYSEHYLVTYGNITQESSVAVTAINYSVSPLGMHLDYENPNLNFTGFGHQANKFVINVLEHYGFTFESENNTQNTKIPCIFAINLITPKPTYMSEGKSDIDFNPYQHGFASVARAVAQKVRTFKSAKMETPDLEEQREDKERERQDRKNDRQSEWQARQRRKQRKAEERAAKQAEKERRKREKLENKKKFKNLYQVTEAVLMKRIEEFEAAGRDSSIFDKRITNQDTGVWYASLSLLADNNIPESEQNRDRMKSFIPIICRAHNVKREDLGIIAGARSVMYYMGEYKAVSYFEVAELAKKGVHIVFIEKSGMVEAFKNFTHSPKIALVNSQGHLTEYGKELSELALESGGRVSVVVDYDLNGILIASKLGPNVSWIGINNDTIRYFDIPLPTLPDPHGKAFFVYPKEERRRVVVPYVKAKPKDKEFFRRLIQDGENEIEDEETGEKKIVKDTRFMGSKVDLGWLWVKDTEIIKKNGKKGKGVEGHKIEIDAVVEDQGNESVWQYILDQIAKYHPTCDYRRVINTELALAPPTPPALEFPYHSFVVNKVNERIRIKSEELAKDKKDEIVEELKDYPSLQNVSELEKQKLQELSDTVLKDEEIQDIQAVCKPILTTLETEIDEKVKEKREKIEELQEAIEELQEEITKTAEFEINETEQSELAPAIKRLAQEKGYDYDDIITAAGDDDDGDGGGEGSQN